MDLNKISNFIVYLRKEKKLTQFQLAEKLGVSDKTVSKWERGICLPESATVEKLIKFFNISLMEFYAGERNKRLTDEIANETTKNAVELSKKNENKKFKKLLYFVVISFVVIMFVVSLLFMYNTYNKYHVYNISSSNKEFIGKGNIILAGDKSIITLMNLSLINEEIYNKEAYAFEYSITLGNVLLYKFGDIYLLEKNNNSNKVKIGKCIEDINIYLNYDLSDMTKKDMLDKTNLTLKLKYINNKFEVDEYEMNFNILKSFSNNKIIMPKIAY